MDKNTLRNSVIRFCSATVLIALLFGITGCLSSKPSGGTKAKNYFETFYVGQEGTQYYIKPLNFSSKDGKEKLFADLTFRYKDKVQDSAIVNFSIKGPNLYKSLSKMAISNGKTEFNGGKIDLLFNEKDKDVFESRFSSKVSLIELKELFEKDAWTMTIEGDQGQILFKADNKAEKAIDALNNKVFVIM